MVDQWSCPRCKRSNEGSGRCQKCWAKRPSGPLPPPSAAPAHAPPEASPLPGVASQCGSSARPAVDERTSQRPRYAERLPSCGGDVEDTGAGLFDPPSRRAYEAEGRLPPAGPSFSRPPPITPSRAAPPPTTPIRETASLARPSWPAPATTPSSSAAAPAGLRAAATPTAAPSPSVLSSTPGCFVAAPSTFDVSQGSVTPTPAATRDDSSTLLNAEQLRAATHPATAPLIVFAPAGAGKTLTLVHRVRYLTTHGCVRPGQILCLTFTRKAAAEIRERVQQLGSARAEVATFHGWSLRLLRTFASELGRKPDFRLSSNAQQLELLREAVLAYHEQHGHASRRSGGDERAEHPGQSSGVLAKREKDQIAVVCRRLQKAMAQAKTMGSRSHAHGLALLDTDLGRFVLPHYEAALNRAGLLDMADLQRLATELLTRPHIVHALQRQYAHVLVDEYQDTNLQQLQLVHSLAAAQAQAHHQPHPQQPPAALAVGVTVVGDDDQSIYSFRGAEPGIFDAFRNRVAGCATVTLTENFRSRGAIVEAAKAVIQADKRRAPKEVWTRNHPGEPVELCQSRNAQCEVDWVVCKLQAFKRAGVQFKSIAVLYRTHAVGRQVYQALREKHLPCSTSSSDVFARPDVAPLVAVLRLLAHEGDDAAFRAVVAKTSPSLPGPFMAELTADAERAGTSLMAAARSAHAASGMLAAARPDAPPRRVIDPDTRSALHRMLRLVDDLTTAAKALTPESLLQKVITSRIVQEVRPEAPPHGAKLLAHELSEGVASTTTGEAAVPSLAPPDAGSMAPPPPPPRDRLHALRAFLEHSALSEHEQEGAGGRASGVTLATIHGAKGREWDVVLLVRANEDTLPLAAPFETEDGEDAERLREERRLLYVAMTRARQRLLISHLLTGPDNVPAQISRFLCTDLPAHVLRRTEHLELQSAGGSNSHGVAYAQHQSQRTPSPSGRLSSAQSHCGAVQDSRAAAAAAAPGPTGAIAAKIAAWQEALAAKGAKPPSKKARVAKSAGDGGKSGRAAEGEARENRGAQRADGCQLADAKAEQKRPALAAVVGDASPRGPRAADHEHPKAGCAGHGAAAAQRRKRVVHDSDDSGDDFE